MRRILPFFLVLSFQPLTAQPIEVGVDASLEFLSYESGVDGWALTLPTEGLRIGAAVGDSWVMEARARAGLAEAEGNTASRFLIAPALLYSFNSNPLTDSGWYGGAHFAVDRSESEVFGFSSVDTQTGVGVSVGFRRILREWAALRTSIDYTKWGESDESSARTDVSLRAGISAIF